MHEMLRSFYLETPLGAMLAIGDEQHLYLLQFADAPKLDRMVQALRKKFKAVILPGVTAAILLIQKELQEYFAGTRKTFTVPLYTTATPFQEKVWKALNAIPYGTTLSYSELAQNIENPQAYRAVAQANGNNLWVIVVPCHRVIYQDHSVGGYSCGLERKRWLLEHERL